MKRVVMAMMIWGLAAVGRGHGAELTAPGEDLFKWGEYDSLIRILEPATRSNSPAVLKTGADSTIRAKSFLFLGVAFYATGKPALADSAFITACDLDPKVKLDRFYVTEEIANYFQAIALDAVRSRNKRIASAANSTPPAASHASLSTRPPKGRESSPQLRSKDGNSWIWVGLGASALVAVGGAYYFTSHSGKPADQITEVDAR
jgi:hypothetical protein